jgi:hypothetical protein
MVKKLYNLKMAERPAADIDMKAGQPQPQRESRVEATSKTKSCLSPYDPFEKSQWRIFDSDAQNQLIKSNFNF